jgi:predicted glycoside hydrolase/deacetylase ChbG (UPF0249 family)
VRSCYNPGLVYKSLVANIKYQGLHIFKGLNIKPLVINWLSKKLASMLKAQQIPTNSYFSGIYDFNLQQRSYATVFANFLPQLQPNTLIMCHPGWVDAELAAADCITTSREQELQFFLSDAFIQLLSQHNLCLG